MSFPSVERIVYSTCSVHATENELVLCKALKNEAAQRLGFKLAERKEVIPSWHRRGLNEHLSVNAECVIRCNPGDDYTNGFFVSMLVKVGTSHPAIPNINNNKRKTEEEPMQKKKGRRKNSNQTTT